MIKNKDLLYDGELPMKKLRVILMGLLLLLCMSACSNKQEKENTDYTEKAQKKYIDNLVKGKIDQAENNMGIEEELLYDENDVKITVLKMEKNEIQTILTLRIENQTEKDCTFYAEDISVNNCMIMGSCYQVVDAGKKANTKIYLHNDEMEACGIERIGKIEFSIKMHEKDKYDDMLSTGPLCVKTNYANENDYVYDDSGYVFYDDKDIKIVFKEISEDEMYLGPSLVFYVENKTNRSVAVMEEDFSVNGYMVNAYLSAYLPPGKCAFSYMTIMETDLNEYGIKEFSEIEMSFRILDRNTWKAIAETDTVKMKINKK